ncbi:MAG: PDZ domain-containing protein, partial [Alphaproteobacteria bacterium]
ADPRTDLAILKIEVGDEDLPVLELTDSDTIEVGDISLAIGNPFGVGQTVTSGIVSATARTNRGISDFQFFIQTDASVNPGNSGGALVGLDGKLMGINTAIFTRTGDSAGIGFAIPSNMVKTVVEAALANGAIVRPWVGFSGQAVTFQIAQSLGLERPGGVLVDSIYPEGPAERAGLLPGDIILLVDGKEIIDTPGLNFRIATAGEGAEVLFTVNRSSELVVLPVMLEMPPEVPPRDETVLEGRHLFQQVKVVNLSPRVSEELGIDVLETGVLVLEVDPRSPAGRRNFVRPGDIFLSLNGTPIDLVSDLVAALEVESEDYIYELRRQGRTIECGLIGSRSFYCQES